MLGTNIVGVQDLPAAWRVGLRLESKCEVRGRRLVYEEKKQYVIAYNSFIPTLSVIVYYSPS